MEREPLEDGEIQAIEVDEQQFMRAGEELARNAKTPEERQGIYERLKEIYKNLGGK